MKQQRGVSGSVQVALLLPFVCVLFFSALQWALMQWAQATVVESAISGAREAAANSPVEGERTAQRLACNGAVSDVVVRVENRNEGMHVVVEGEAVRLLPGISTRVVGKSTARIETRQSR